MRKMLVSAVAIAVACAATTTSLIAQEKIRIGIVSQASGPFAEGGKQFRLGIEAFQALNGKKVGGREVEVIYRDVGGPNAAAAKRLAEDLVLNEKVSILGGFYLTPDASAAVPIINEAKVPSIVFQAAGAPLMRASPYFVRVSNTLWQNSWVAAEYAIKLGKKRAYVSVPDFAPGTDSEMAFKTRFTELGGTVLGVDRVPLNTVDFAPFVARIVNAKPDVVHTFTAGGAGGLAFIRAIGDGGLLKNGIPVIGADFDDTILPVMNESIIGFYNGIQYDPALQNDENKKFLTEIHRAAGANQIVNFMAVQAYDGMRVAYEMIGKQKPGSTFDPSVAMSAAAGFSWQSPRGPVRIDKESRTLVENFYIREVVQADGKLALKIVDTLPAVEDPWHRLNPVK